MYVLSVAKVHVVIRFCKRCNEETKHRLVRDSRPGKGDYHTCAVCLDNNSKRHRKRHWLRYLAQKANGRKKPGSEQITEEMLRAQLEKQDYCCALSGRPFDMDLELYRPSLDRVDSGLPYSRDNIQLVLFIVNKMKRELDQSEFVEVCSAVTEHLQSRGVYCGD